MIAIEFTEDDVTMEEIDEDEVARRIATDYWGDRPVFAAGALSDLSDFVGVVLIEGAVVLPIVGFDQGAKRCLGFTCGAAHALRSEP